MARTDKTQIDAAADRPPRPDPSTTVIHPALLTLVRLLARQAVHADLAATQPPET